MEVNINGNAEMIVRRLVEIGRFPSADSAVNSVILRTFSDLTSEVVTGGLLPDPPVSFEEEFQIMDIPLRYSEPVVARCIEGHLLPDPVDVE